MAAAPVIEWLGGARGLGARARSDHDLALAVERGLPASAIDAFMRRARLSAVELDTLVIPRRTLTHRRRLRQRLSLDESDKLLRLARLLSLTEDTFGDADKAHHWLRQPNRALEGATPLELARTSQGARLVEDVLVRIATGVFS